MQAIRTNQQGVALVTVILIVAIAATVATALSFQQRVDIRRTSNIMHWEQAYQYALSAEDLAKLLLIEDAKSDNDAKSPKRWDSLDEEWAKKRDPFPTDNGYISGYIEDLQGRFNLNNLVYFDSSKNNANSNNTTSTNMAALAQFVRLLDAVLPPDIQRTRRPAEELANAVVDWIDKNSESKNPGGAEDLDYQSLEKPYRAANTWMSSTSELLLVAGFDKEIYDKLAPYVTALPNFTKINVNTAPAAVLQSLDSLISEADAEKLTFKKPEKNDEEVFEVADPEQQDPFEKPEDFLKKTSIKPENHGKILPLIDVRSQFFQLNAITRFSDSQARLNSVFYRSDETTITVIMRGQGVL